jgi:multidrug efflux pump subunit AcrB
LLVAPLGVLGTVIGALVFRMFNDVYFQVGLLTTIGLASKNAILIVEFAKEEVARGIGFAEAALNAARLRLRPILMTSIAFILGVLPLALASGAGSGSERAIGVAVIGGMTSGTVLAILFVPVFFVAVFRISRPRRSAKPIGVSRTSLQTLEATQHA